MADRQDRPTVFCGRCQWYRQTHLYDHPSRRLVRIEHVCLHPHALYVHTTPTAVQTLRHTATQRNANNDCPDFQPLRGWRWVRRHGGVPIVLVLLLWGLLWLWLTQFQGGR